MKISINKSAKRALSTALALAMIFGTLFTANIGTTVIAGATTPIKEGTIDLLEFGSYLTEMGSTSTYFDTKLADNGETGTADDPIIIDSAEEFVYLSKQGGGGNVTAGKYYKVADGIAGFDLSNGNLNLDGTLAENLEKIQAGGKNHSGDTNNPFQGNFDGNGVTVYGAVINGGSYSGVFSNVKNTVSIKNLNVRLCSFKGTSAVGGIVGYHKADVIAYEKNAPMHSVTIENCTVADVYLEVTGTGWGTGIGAIMGRGDAAPSWKEADKGVDGNGDGDTSDTIYVNTPYIIKNCFVNQNEDYFKSSRDDKTEASGERTCHGGVAGMSGSNALSVSDCVVIGITPYATTDSSVYNDVQHTGLASHFKNVYTDQATGSIVIGGQPSWAGHTQDFSSVVFKLTDAQLKGAAAVSAMNLAWFSNWIPGADGEYPTVNQTNAESDTYFWDGTADTKYAGGTGTKEDPYIIKTPAQLYAALSTVTDATNGVVGGIQTSQILKQGSTTEYVPVYTPYYYKVADGVKNFYFNNVYGNETLAGIKALVAGGTAKDWKPQKSFVGHLDGNGVNIYGLYSSLGQGLIKTLDGSSTVKNINFAACYSKGTGQAAILTTFLGSYSNDSTLIYVENISVRESRTETTGKVTQYTDSVGNQHTRAAGGIICTGSTCENLTMSNCFYDGYTCEIVAGDGSLGVGQVGGIISGGSGMNNVMLSGCVSLGAPVVDEVYIAGTEFGYNRYDKNQGFQVFFYDCYTDQPNVLCAKYPDKYEKLSDIERVEVSNTYGKFDFPTLAWGSNWAFVTIGERTFPMPLVNTAEEAVGSYVQVIGLDHNKHASVGPYKYGSNPFTYLLKGSGTPEDPFIIETAAQLARAIATGGMNLYDRLYYRLGNDIDISGGTWITQTEIHTGGIHYTYTPFGGSLDGNGHVITGLSVGDKASAGLIPVLADTGEVKNLHLRNANAISSTYAGAIAGEVVDDASTDTVPTIKFCSVEGADIAAKEGTSIFVGTGTATMDNVYYVTVDNTAKYIANGAEYNETNCTNIFTVEANKANWYIGGKEGSTPKLKNLNSHANDLDVSGDGTADGYGAADLTALRNKLLRRSGYDYINGDVSRNNVVNLADLAVLQRTIAGNYGEKITDSFFGNVAQGQIEIYYGENDNYDAARKVELYLESLFPEVDVEKHVSTSKGTVTGANSDADKVYLHKGDKAENPDGKFDIIVGDVVGYSAESSMADNTYEVTYDEANKVVWFKGQNFTAVEQAVLNFVGQGKNSEGKTIPGCNVDGDYVYNTNDIGVQTLDAYKQPVTVKLDTNFDGTPDTNKTMYYAWGDEFDEDTLNTYNWQHNNQQTEGTAGSTNTSYNNQEVAPVKDLGKVLVVENGKLSMKRGHDSKLNSNDVSWNGIVGSVALDVTPGEYNGYTVWNSTTNTSDNTIDTNGSDQYFCSGKVTTDRGMLYKQGYLEFEGQVPADGHAFPAWWLMGRPASSQSNTGYDNSLYGKIYKLNDKWNGSATYVANDLDTYKYQIPSAIYEIDMIEVMQHVDRHWTKSGDSEWGINLGGSYHPSHKNEYKTRTTATYLYYLNSTVHKWWTNGTAGTNDTALYIQDWDNYKVSSAIDNSSFSTTSSAGSWIHNIGSTLYDFGTKETKYLGSTVYWDTSSYYASAHDNLTTKRRYGFSWYTDGVSNFEATLYIYNADGKGTTVTVPIASGMSDYAAFKDGSKQAETSGIIGTTDNGAFKNVYSDAKVFNQYMYILFDNKYYSSNDNMTGSNEKDAANMFTDLLNATGLKSFEIDYIRVYQQDGQRDIVTQETENFNNGNHFGY